MAFAAERRNRWQQESMPQAAPAPAAPRNWFDALTMAESPPAATGKARQRDVKPGRNGRQNQAEVLVDVITRRIIKLGWPVGRPLGSETELMKQYNVSRVVLRQAVRLLEHHSIATVRRGPAGGLAVAEPTLTATIRAVSVFLEYARIDPADIRGTRKTLELSMLELVVKRLDAEACLRLQDLIDEEAQLDGSASAEKLQRFHALLGELCGDAALKLFGIIVLRLASVHSTFGQRSRADQDAVVARIKRYHKEIAYAIIVRDLALAQRKLTRYIDATSGWY